MAITYGEAIDHVETLMDTPGTHTHAAVAGWDYPATWAEIATVAHAEWFLNRYRDVKKQRNPITLPRPWSDTPKVVVTDDERALLRARLVASSPFAH